MDALELLKSITADELHDAFDAEQSAFEAGTEDATTVYQWLHESYPEICRFALSCVNIFVEDDDADASELIELDAQEDNGEEEIIGLETILQLNALATLGAFCRVIEAKSLPSL